MIAYVDACPCSESEVGYFLLLWASLFALPGVALVAVGIGVSKRLRPAHNAE